MCLLAISWESSHYIMSIFCLAHFCVFVERSLKDERERICLYAAAREVLLPIKAVQVLDAVYVK